MRASLLVLGVLVLIVCLGNENGVYASPVPGPCNYFLQFQPPTTTTTTTTPPPKPEEEKLEEEKIKLLRSILFGNTEKKAEVKEPEPEKPKTYDMNTMFAAYMEFFTKFFNML